MVVFNQSTLTDCRIIELPRIQSSDGSLSFVQDFDQIPFSLKRVYYLYDVPGGEGRGGHAHHNLHQFLIAASGSFDVLLNDGREKSTIQLNRPYQALQIVPGIWRELTNFSSGGVCLVLASELYDEDDYIRDESVFYKLKLKV